MNPPPPPLPARPTYVPPLTRVRTRHFHVSAAAAEESQMATTPLPQPELNFDAAPETIPLPCSTRSKLPHRSYHPTRMHHPRPRRLSHRKRMANFISLCIVQIIMISDVMCLVAVLVCDLLAASLPLPVIETSFKPCALQSNRFQYASMSCWILEMHEPFLPSVRIASCRKREGERGEMRERRRGREARSPA